MCFSILWENSGNNSQERYAFSFIYPSPSPITCQAMTINGASYGVGFGCRFRPSKTIGFGASLRYHALSLSKETTNPIEKNVSDKLNNIMTMLEFTLLTR